MAEIDTDIYSGCLEFIFKDKLCYMSRVQSIGFDRQYDYDDQNSEPTAFENML